MGDSSGHAYRGCLNHELGALYNVKVDPASPSRRATGPKGDTGPAFPTLISGGYSANPGGIANLAATGPTGDNNWQVTVANTSGQTVALTVYTICAKD
jgi:hypothetical protein